MQILSCEHITKSFGGVKAVDDVTISIEQDRITGMIGSNGAGKTTLFNILTGYTKPDSGTVVFENQNGALSLYHKLPHELAMLGISRTFQNIRLFEQLSVKEHLTLAKHVCKSKVDIKKLLKNLGLTQIAERDALSLAYGEKRYVEIGRAIATGATLIFLDEPCAGLNPEECVRLQTLLADAKAQYHLTLCMIEHNMDFIAALCDRVYAMDFGRIICSGTAQQVLKDDLVRSVILGERV